MTDMASQDFKNPHLETHDDKNELIAIAAAKGAGLALVAGGLVAMSGARYSRTYQTMSRSMKMFLLGSGVAATSILFGDHARVHYEDRQLLRHLDAEAAEAKRAEIRAQRGVLAELNYQVRENRNMVVGVAWLSCMAGSLGYTFSKKGLTTTQRIVTARMYAQGFTILTMMAVAAIELTEPPRPKQEVLTDQWKAILAKDRQGNYIVKDPATQANNSVAAASLSAPSTAVAASA
ncbi:hypothetical protein BC939DRAFT_497469 [Gamsiella multidivaricata]|uniref:uncharacterized protein n=1 Tax=Gamsiella multidivaricata TaxID=101098 RepID=UPI00221F64BC|nr:uncharacterized protein BC939DRAFT_497469 [Gamsiella multidivaricata]KAG0359195.1 hypothetical protein BGZ54_010065 [Gamsiella multidivaricata]KAI7816346.1 hypothetical protein BC939DRAFT_497469 [Gamsiella multidivaricata]